MWPVAVRLEEQSRVTQVEIRETHCQVPIYSRFAIRIRHSPENLKTYGDLLKNSVSKFEGAFRSLGKQKLKDEIVFEIRGKCIIFPWI